MSADDKPLSDSDAIFARGYAAALKPLLGVSGGAGKHQLILTSPPTQRGIAAGSDIDSKYTGYLIYKFANALQDSDNPVYSGSGAGNYADQLASRMQDKDASEQNKRWLKEAQATFAEAAKRSRETKKEAEKDWEDAKSGRNFEHWASIEYPELQQARERASIAQTDLQQAEQSVNGAQAVLLSGYRGRMDRAQNVRDGLPGYNQQVISQLDQPQATTYVPLYSIDTYTKAVDHWYEITKGIPREKVKRDQVITIDISEGRKTNWEDYGFKEVRGGGNVGFWPFFHADVNNRSTTERRELNTKDRESCIDLVLAMVGVLKFDVTAGLWDSPDIKTIFPTLRPGAPPDVLGPKYARVTSLLCGFDVQLKVKFAAEMREEVNQIYQEVKEKGGNLTIFGIRFSVGAGGGSRERDEYKFKDIEWDKFSGSLTITPSTGQLTPTFLGAIARRFD
ncbi:hypothetical protein DXG01_002667 [Tephrocybe rancida]|nr:hypothetical protein DXG01_002667 [Tephrocybe rancida]